MMNNQENEKELLLYYKKLNRESSLLCDELRGQLDEKDEEILELKRKLSNIKDNPLWKATYPGRYVYHTYRRAKDSVVRCGSAKGIVKKAKRKLKQKELMRQHGSNSFPSETERRIQETSVFSQDVVFSILVPLYNTPKRYLEEMISSVRTQTYRKWELCLADGSDEDHSYVGSISRKYAVEDDRIRYQKLDKNYGISGNTNKCLEMASGNWIALFDHDDVLHPCALYEYMKVICEHDVDYIYCDECTFQGKSIDNMLVLHFKPDYSIDNLRANNYICHFSAFKTELIERVGGFRSEYDGSQDHDLILRLTDQASNVYHVPQLLYYWRSHKNSVALDINAKKYAIDAAKRAVKDNLASHGLNAKVMSTEAFPTIFRIKYELISKPKVSIVIANKDHLADLKRCIESIMARSSYENYEIVIVENNSITAEIFEYYEQISRLPNIKVVTYEGTFNYSAINNLGVRNSDGEYVLLLNNDTAVISRNWIEELLMYAQREDVGAVGGKLYYEDKTIQHAGIVIGLGRHHTAGHTHYRENKENYGYMGRLCFAQNCTAVTGACLMVKREIYDEVKGLDETFEVALNDVDFCLKLRKSGYLNVFTPFCEMYHYESKSRGSDEGGSKAERYEVEAKHFRKKWKEELLKGDPYYNPNFSLYCSDYVLKDWASER